MYRVQTYSCFILSSVCLVLGITNNADLIWYEKDNEPHNYFARQPIPEGLVKSRRIVVNQKVPILYEVKFAFFDNLESLVINDCGINEIRTNTFKDLKPLTNLSLTRNHIKELKVGVFNFCQIKNLDLAHNRISIIAEGAFDNMPVLERLILDSNELRHWNTHWFCNSTRLRTVSITHNFLQEIPADAFRNFWKQQAEIDVYFSYNKIASIDPDAFERSGNFGDFFVDWNDLLRVDGDTMRKMKAVRHLNLDGDSLRCFSEEFYTSVLNKTKVLSVRENPLECHCLHELQKRASDIKLELSHKQIANCSLPK